MAQADSVTSVVRAPITGAGARTSRKPFQAVWDELVVGLERRAPGSIPLPPADFEDWPDHLRMARSALAYPTAALDDTATAPNMPSGLIRKVQAILSDLISDQASTLASAVEIPARRTA
jgi:hypothetical protein